MCSNGRRKSFWKLKPGSSPVKIGTVKKSFFLYDFDQEWGRGAKAIVGVLCPKIMHYLENIVFKNIAGWSDGTNWTNPGTEIKIFFQMCAKCPIVAPNLVLSESAGINRFCLTFGM